MNDTPTQTPTDVDAIIQAAYAKEGITFGGGQQAASVPDYMQQPAPVAPAVTPTAPPVQVPDASTPAPAPQGIQAPGSAPATPQPALGAPVAQPAKQAPTMTLSQAAEIVPTGATPQQLDFLAQQAGTDAATLQQFAAMASQYKQKSTPEGQEAKAPAPAQGTPTPTTTPSIDPLAAQLEIATMYNAIGGHDKWNDFAVYMEKAADPATLALYKTSDASGQARIAAIYAEGFKASPTRRDITSGVPTTPSTSGTQARTPEQVQAMFADPKYTTDPAFRTEAMKALIALGG